MIMCYFTLTYTQQSDCVHLHVIQNQYDTPINCCYLSGGVAALSMRCVARGQEWLRRTGTLCSPPVMLVGSTLCSPVVDLYPSRRVGCRKIQLRVYQRHPLKLRPESDKIKKWHPCCRGKPGPVAEALSGVLGWSLRLLHGVTFHVELGGQKIKCERLQEVSRKCPAMAPGNGKPCGMVRKRRWAGKKVRYQTGSAEELPDGPKTCSTNPIRQNFQN